MTVQEMYQEMNEQLLEDILNGYKELDIYDEDTLISLIPEAKELDC